MKTSLIIAVASAGLLAAPVLAQSHGGGGGGGGMGMGAGPGGMHNGAGMGPQSMGMPPGVDVRTGARIDAQSPLHANDRALDRVNDNSVLNDTRTPTGADMTTGSDRRATARMRARGDEHASAMATSKADANSEVATSTSVRHRKHAHKPR